MTNMPVPAGSGIAAAAAEATGQLCGGAVAQHAGCAVPGPGLQSAEAVRQAQGLQQHGRRRTHH